MDLATVLGLVLGSTLVTGSIIVGGGSIGQFYDTPSVLCVFGGGIAAVLVSYPMSFVLGFHKVFLITIFNKSPDIKATIAQIVSLSDTARREGILSLENRMEEIENPQLALGLRMAVDGMSTDVVENILRTELEAVYDRHSKGKGLIGTLGKYVPAFGMIGTLIGLVLMLSDLDPATIGTGMAVALLTTFYGAVAANAVFLPLADKLGFLNDKEILNMEIVIRGVMAIQAGENPRVTKQKLETFLPPKDRTVEEQEGAA
ncbi:MAG: motility protein A [Planctomycetaceae bacterium]|jgi:chemotaxis protein MotA|nr:motility protein A [Planctomycetaceae bacterium]